MPEFEVVKYESFYWLAAHLPEVLSGESENSLIRSLVNFISLASLYVVTGQ